MVLLLGGMGFFMSFIGCAGSPISESGLVDIMSCAFRDVDHMVTGKYFTHTFRVLRLLVETVIHNTVHEANDDADLISYLQYCARSSRTAKFWAGGLMKPVFLMMIFCQAEQEVYGPLHLRAYFFTARQHNCARFGMYYLHSSEAMPNEICRQFLQEEHVTRHVSGAWNGTWTYMMSDDRTNFVRYGKGLRGLIGIF